MKNRINGMHNCKNWVHNTSKVLCIIFQNSVHNSTIPTYVFSVFGCISVHLCHQLNIFYNSHNVIEVVLSLHLYLHFSPLMHSSLWYITLCPVMQCISILNAFSEAQTLVPGASNKLGEWLTVTEYVIFLHGLAQPWRLWKKWNLAQR